MKILKDNIQKYQISDAENIREAIKHLDIGGIGFITIIDKGKKVRGIITDGDFRRAILKGISLDSNVLDIANKDFSFVEGNYSEKEVINLFLKRNIFIIPVLKEGRLFAILHRGDYELAQKFIISNKKRDISVVIMAGGKGMRMKPFTNILPKPLIPIGEQSILEVIMDRYSLFFNANFFISVNYKANVIKAYLDEFKNKYDFSFIDEDKPLGTGGALQFLKNKIKGPVFVSNCDIIIKSNYQDIYEKHLKNGYDITIVASMMHYKIPYGVCEINKSGLLNKMVEKPEFDFLVNAGMYIINPTMLKYIPENKFYNITDLINIGKKDGKNIGVYPVSEKSYLDLGQWSEYEKNTGIS